MTTLPVYSTSGTKLTPIKVSDKIFKAKIKPGLMAQAIRVYLGNQRQAAARTKDRGDVNVTHAKVWRQKGTGRARHGSRNAPLFVGGAKAHGPSGEQNYKRKLAKKLKHQSLFSALTQQYQDKNILVVSGLEKLQAKTKIFDKLWQKLVKKPQNLLLLLDKDSLKKLNRPVRNLAYLATELVTNLSTYPALRAGKIIFTKDSLKVLEEFYAH